jgi:hypothetical protein
MAAPYDSYTDFPNGITSAGVPIFGGYGKVVTAVFGRTWFVNANSTVPPWAGWSPGSNGYSGQSPTQPFLTMAKALSVVDSGDVINFIGKIEEQLVTPVQVFDVWINGCGLRPRDPDAVPNGGQYGAAEWKAPATGGVAAQATLRVLQQGWRFTNFLWRAIDVNAACLEIVRNAAALDAERDASHSSVIGCRFSGTGIGIRGGVAGLFTEIPFNVEVAGSQFDNMTTAMAAAIVCNQWFIHDNVFQNNTSHITMAAQNFTITRNVVGAFTAAANSGGIDLRGGAGLNQVVGNWLSGTYSAAGGYQEANANDTWNGNFASTGVTAGVP